MKSKQYWIMFGIVGIAAAGALSCTVKPRAANALKDPLNYTELRKIPYTEITSHPKYDKENGIDLAGAANVIFMWKNNPETDGQIMRYSDEIGDLLDETPAKVLAVNLEDEEPFTGHVEKTAQGVEGVVFYDRVQFRDWKARLKDADTENDQEPEKFAITLLTDKGVVGYNVETATKVELEQVRFPLQVLKEFPGSRMDNIVKYKTIYTVAGMLGQAQAGEKKLIAGVEQINQGIAQLNAKKTELTEQENAIKTQLVADPNNEELKTKLAQIQAGATEVEKQLAATDTKKVETEKQLATVQGQIEMLKSKIAGVPEEVIAVAPQWTAWLAQPVLNRKMNIAALADYFPFSKKDGQSGLAPKVNLKFDGEGKPHLTLVWDIDGFEGTMVNEDSDKANLGFGNSKTEKEKLAALHKSVSTFTTEATHENPTASIYEAEYIEVGGALKFTVKPWNNLALQAYLTDKLNRAQEKYDMKEVERVKHAIEIAKMRYDIRMDRDLEAQKNQSTASLNFTGGMSRHDLGNNKRMGQVKIGL